MTLLSFVVGVVVLLVFAVIFLFAKALIAHKHVTVPKLVFIKY